jgi:hypothetical protein
MITESQRLAAIIESAYARLRSIPEKAASEKPYADKWSLKEVLGHLIDSASNNHQRFVRMQESEHIGTFTYSQLHWVQAQDYQSEPWNHLVELWHIYNLHLAHVIANVEPAALAHLCDVGDPQPASLKLIIEDYVRHVEHHLEQIFSGVDPRNRKRWEG